MKVRIRTFSDDKDKIIFLCSIEQPGKVVAISLPPEFDREIVLSRVNQAFDALEAFVNSEAING